MKNGYDDYIYRIKLTEQKNKKVEHKIPSPR